MLGYLEQLLACGSYYIHVCFEFPEGTSADTIIRIVGLIDQKRSLSSSVRESGVKTEYV